MPPRNHIVDALEEGAHDEVVGRPAWRADDLLVVVVHAGVVEFLSLCEPVVLDQVDEVAAGAAGVPVRGVDGGHFSAGEFLAGATGESQGIVGEGGGIAQVG